MKNIPDKIWLVTGLSNTDEEVKDFKALSEVTWSEDKIFDHDVPFRRVDGKFIYHHEEDGTLIVIAGGEGTCSVKLDEVKSCAWVYRLSVEEKHRRNGYGKLLLSEAEDEARRLGASVMSLAVKKDTFMLDWYQRSGYEPLFSDSEYVTLYKKIAK
jgi:hypothetical protein|nr:MAG TPA: acetyltransferase domain containing protein [Herelleviridae sp.]